MATCSKKSAAESKSSGKRKKSGSDSEPANFLVKRKLKDDLETKPMILKKLKEEEVVVKKKTILVHALSKYAGVADIIDFFKDVGQVVRVQLIVHHSFRKSRKYGFIKFASSNEADKALEKIKNLHGPQIFALIFPYVNIRPRYCKDHKVWNKDFILREEEEDEKTTPKFVENVLFVSNLSPQTKLFHIIDCFSHVGQVVSVRLIVNPEGKHVGYGFVELGSAYQAHKALEKMNGEYLLDHKIFIDVAKLPPYSLQTQYNFAEKLCYEDYLQRAILVRDKDEKEDRLYQEAVAVINKTIFVKNLPLPTKIQDLIDILKDVGKVVHVRLLIDCEGNQTGHGYVEFASAEEAEKAPGKEYFLDDQGIFLYSADSSIELQHHPKYCIDHKVWYEDYLGRENRLIEEDEEVEEGFDETHDLEEEVSLRKKTLFVYNLPPRIRRINLFDYYKNVGQVCRVRLVVNREGEHVGCGFVEFASADEAMMALLYEDSRTLKILSDVVEMAPYPIRPKYKDAESLWNEEYLRPDSLPTEEDYEEDYLEKPEVTELFCGWKKTFFHDDD
ncbi:RNA recognition motif domain-containing protein [Hirschfeldia incana]|nr:RNA recognition motif domain-containing protein [Hirschfeldia incana]